MQLKIIKFKVNFKTFKPHVKVNDMSQDAAIPNPSEIMYLDMYCMY
jgi:hypothetical protein